MFNLTYLIVFKLLDSLVLLALTLSLYRVWPLGDAHLTNLVQLLALIHTHSLVILFLVSLRAHALDSLELIDRKDSCVLSCQCLGLLFCISQVGFIKCG